MGMIDHLEQTYAAFLNYKEISDFSLENEQSSDSFFRVSGKLRYLAAVEIRLRGDVESFRSRILRGVQLKKSLLEAYDKGSPISPSYVTMSGFHWGLDACAAGDIELSRSFFELIGGRVKEERSRDSKLFSSIGYAVKELFLQGGCSEDRLRELKEQFKQTSSVGYAQLIEGISNRDIGQSEKGVNGILKGHKMLTRTSGIFWSTPDEIVCFWALGLLNYAAFQGMKISSSESDLLPKSLIMDVK